MYFQNNPHASQKDYLLNLNKNNKKKLIRTTLNTWLSPDIKAKIICRFNKKINNLNNDGENSDIGDTDDDVPDLNNAILKRGY